MSVSSARLRNEKHSMSSMCTSSMNSTCNVTRRNQLDTMVINHAQLGPFVLGCVLIAKTYIQRTTEVNQATGTNLFAKCAEIIQTNITDTHQVC